MSRVLTALLKSLAQWTLHNTQNDNSHLPRANHIVNGSANAVGVFVLSPALVTVDSMDDTELTSPRWRSSMLPLSNIAVGLA
jgi:hypothetical protein